MNSRTRRKQSKDAMRLLSSPFSPVTEMRFFVLFVS